MRTRNNLLLSAAFLAAIASSAVGQGLGYPEAPNHRVTRPARYWFDDGYIVRAWTGRVGFMATNGCDAKPICSVCDYSKPRVCGCSHQMDLKGQLSRWFGCGAGGDSCGCGSHPMFGTRAGATQKKGAAQKWSRPKPSIQKFTVQKGYAPKRTTQKCPQQKPAIRKCAPQKCVTQKCPVTKCPTQKCAKSGGSKSGCGFGCRPSLLDSLADHIASLDLFGRPLGGCKPKCGRCAPTMAKVKSKSGGMGIPSTLPVPMSPQNGDDSPEVDPSIPPDPTIEGGDEIDTGAGNVHPVQPRWRRARSPRSSMPRLLPADNSARDVSRISYQELIQAAAPRKLQDSQSSRRLDIFKAASELAESDSEASSKPEKEKAPVRNSPVNPLRK